MAVQDHLLLKVGQFGQVKVSFFHKSAAKRSVNPCFTQGYVVKQVGEWSIESIDPTVRLLGLFVRVVLRPEECRICLNAFPSLGTSGILHKVNPTVCFGYFLMFVPIPFGQVHTFKSPQDLQFEVKIIENDQFRVLFDLLFQRLEAARMRPYTPTHQHKHLSSRPYRPIFPRIPPIPHDLSHLCDIVIHGNCYGVSGGVSFVGHFDDDLISPSNQPTCINISIHGRELRVRFVDDVISLKRRAILDETVRDENRDVVQPTISGGS